jgi:endonuclease-8
MPEGDSVYRLAARLRGGLDGALIAGGELPSGAAAGAALTGWRIVEHETHGKHLLTRFDSGHTLHTHLRMQGSWVITSAGRRIPTARMREVRVRMALEDGRTAWGLNLPVVELLPTAREHEAIGHLGPDPLRADWDMVEAVRRLSARPDRPIVAALLDQRIIAGLGNLWANELCFLRGLWPWRRVGEVAIEPLLSLAATALRRSATVPGAYQNTTGRPRRGDKHWVSGRAGRPCLRCGTVILVRAEVADDPERRRTWWCPRCQPER